MTSYVWDGTDWVPRDEYRPSTGLHNIMSDIEPFKSPVDGSWITSRSQIRDHERRHGVRQIGNDWIPPND